MWVFVSAVLCIPHSLMPAFAVSFCVVFKDTLRECRPEDRQCLTYLPWVSPIYFVTFVLMAQFVLVNVVVAVLMKHLEESNKVRTFRSRDLSVIKRLAGEEHLKLRLFLQEAKEDAEMDAEIALEMAMEQQQRRLSMASSHSSAEGTYVGPCPHSPGQVGQNTTTKSSTRVRLVLASLFPRGLCLPL